MVLFLKNLLFTVLVPGTVGVDLPLFITAGRSPASHWALVLALPLWAVGAAIVGWGVWDFATFGRATPAPIDAPTRLVVRGLYQYTRNPMYVGVLTVLAGWVVLFPVGALVVYTALVATMFQLFVVLYEEPHLRRVFGDEYDAYCARVRRWPWGPRPAA
jgi:protein-S-isoprenylcysteine O-methyltransferase Ste14